ncbi:hypothetical protein [Paenibacillus sp. HB172176]|uniref:hypothetical protein n=1 Tax=Paenibacillus sp. HB172176 TaxID=2493690 RepID=UPI00143A71E8|nr:hypothetical protein [Paenibacillus sp. HB172176]
MAVKKSFLTACMWTLIITLGAAWIPYMIREKDNAAHPLAVFKQAPLRHMTNGNIVDILIGVPLREKISHAEWNRSVLAIELSVPADSGRPEAWFEDVRKLIQVSFQQLDNVNRLLIQIVEWSSGNKKLLTAMDIRGSDEWLSVSLSQLDYADPFHDELWRERLRVSFTSAWEERFGKASSFSAKSSKS